MSELDFEFIGWCNDPHENHDKVWTAFKTGNTYYAGWGRRGKKLSFKSHGTGWTGEQSLKDVKRKQQAPKGEYKEVDKFQLFAIFPNFEEDVQKYLMYAVLSNQIK